jgi:hypothetical protein
MKKVDWPCVLVLVAGAACLPLTRRRVMSIWLPVVVAVALVAVALASTILAPSVCGSVVCVGVVVLVVIVEYKKEQKRDRVHLGNPGCLWPSASLAARAHSIARVWRSGGGCDCGQCRCCRSYCSCLSGRGRYGGDDVTAGGLS